MNAEPLRGEGHFFLVVAKGVARNYSNRLTVSFTLRETTVRNPIISRFRRCLF